MGDANCCETLSWLKERVHDKKHFTARGLAQLAELSGMEPELVAKGLGGLLFGILVLSEQAHIVANALLVAVPFLLIFVFPAEKPTDESLFVYFSLLGVLTVLDRSLERIFGYYVVKLALFFLLYAPPYELHKKINDLIQEMLKEKKNTEQLSEMSRSSRKVSPPKSTMTAISSTPAPTSAPPPSQKQERQASSVRASAQPPPQQQEQQEKQTSSTRMSALPTPPPPPPPEQQQEQQEKQKSQQSVPDEPEPPKLTNKPSPTLSSTDISGGSRRLKVGQNPMESNSFYNLRSEKDGFNSGLVGPENNLHDMVFHPADKLVFNAPFDYDNLTYHMRITNNSHHRIAYAVKGNAVPRVLANPPFGILNPKESRLTAVTLQKLAWNDIDYQKDRIAFDYVILPDSNKEKQFTMAMFQHSDTKRRKNIRIEYNP